ncbi:MAG: heterodisulfide reductase-related iron-sulfur binding cluster, partial [Thaumarchaeota archaeon]|nr:heterodisulfide reductase-related iron-sulfur binding cluster [Nitrososphaerota archaeon]
GYRVEVPELKWSGMPYVSYGEIEKATEVSIFNLRILDRYVNEGYTVVSTEPTAIYMLREVYGKLVPGQSTVKIGENSHSFFELIEKDLGKLSLRPVFTTNETIGFHIPCHERALSSGVPAINFLKSVGYKVQVLANGTCCGMAGTFGMKHGDLGYELSVAVGDRLFRLFKESGVRTIATESSVCAMQLFDGVGIQVIHPLYAVEFQ